MFNFAIIGKPFSFEVVKTFLFLLKYLLVNILFRRVLLVFSSEQILQELSPNFFNLDKIIVNGSVAAITKEIFFYVLNMIDG